MSAVDYHSNLTACPGCDATALATGRAAGTAETGDQIHALSLPSMHCAACISTVENGLLALPGVHQVRVNLTRKRASVTAAPTVELDDLTSALARLGYDAQPLDGATLSADHSDQASRDLAMRLGVAGFAMMNVMLFVRRRLVRGKRCDARPVPLISGAIAIPTIAFSAQPFFKSAWGALKRARLNMDVPISLAILLACGMSVFEVTQSGHHAYFDAALSLTFFLLGGRYLDQRTRTVARSAATELAALEVPTALKIGPDGPVTVNIADLALGDAVLVRPGARIPIDGEIAYGASELDRSFLTGESEAVSLNVGDPVRAGEVNLTGPLTVTVTALGKDTFLHALADLISVAEESKSRYNSLADKAAAIYAPVVHILSFLAFAVWMYASGGDVRFALNIAVATLIITCPCALGLAVPAVSTVASGALFKAGILVKHATALERLAEVDTIVFDKTGTLTTGKPKLVNQDKIAPEHLALAAALAMGSEHPRSIAITAAFGGDLPEVVDLTEAPGFGVTGQWNGHKIALGRADWLGDTDAGTALAIDGTVVATFAFQDDLRDGVRDLITRFAALGLPMQILSGDTKANVSKLAQDIRVTNWTHGMLPDEKADALTRLREDGRKVLMVGDGLNDTAALALAHVSIAPASALDATRVAADMVLVSTDMGRLDDALRIARSAKRRILENFAVAACYNAVAIPVAFLGFATPLAAAIAMSTSSIVVSLNALRTR